MKISQKLGLSFSAILAALIIMGAVVWWAQGELIWLQKRLAFSFDHIIVVKKLDSRIGKQIKEAYDLLLTGEREKGFVKYQKSAFNAFEEWENLSHDEILFLREKGREAEEERLISKREHIKRLYIELLADINKIKNSITPENKAEFVHEFSELVEVKLEDRFEKALGEIIAEYREEVAESRKKTDEFSQWIKMITAGIVMGTLAITIIITWVVGRLITNPILKLKEAAVQIGKGDLETRIDITSRDELGTLADSFNQMAKNLRETSVSRNYLDNILKNLMNCLMVLSPEGTIQSVNHATTQLLGYSEHDLLDQELDIILKEKNILNRMRSGKIKNIEYALLSKEGQSIPVLFSASEILGSNGQVTGYAAVAQDISLQKKTDEERQQLAYELKQTNRELEERNVEMEQFTFRVSHDLRSPLVNIKGFAGELGASLETLNSVMNDVLPRLDKKLGNTVDPIINKDIPESLDFINSSVSRMDQLINAILKLARLEKRVMDFQPLDMNELVQTTLKTLAYQIEKQKIEVTVSTLPQVTADRISMDQIMANLLSNAINYLDAKRPGVIKISADRKDLWTVFQVTDNGRGIAEENQKRIFEIFFRAGKHDTSGEGIGLAHVKSLVRRHEGRIWCDSTLGKGTTILFTLSNHLSQRNSQ